MVTCLLHRTASKFCHLKSLLVDLYDFHLTNQILFVFKTSGGQWGLLVYLELN